MNRYSACRTWYVVLLILGLGPIASTAYAQIISPVNVRLAPSAIEIPLGQADDVAIEVVDVHDLYGFDITAQFDPALVEVVDADPNSTGVQVAFGTFLNSGFVALNTVDNTAGTIRFAMTQLNPSEPKSGTGSLIVIHLHGKQVTGGTPLTLVDVQLAKRDGNSLTTNLTSGTIAVVNSASSVPVNTPIPTQGAGTLMPTTTPTASFATSTPTIDGPTTQASPTPTSAVISTSPTPNAAANTIVATSQPTKSVPAQSATEPAPTVAPATFVSTPVAVAALPTNTPVAMNANPAPATPNVIAPIQVTEPATSNTTTASSPTGFVILAAALIVIGVASVLFAMRQRPH